MFVLLILNFYFTVKETTKNLFISVILINDIIVNKRKNCIKYFLFC